MSINTSRRTFLIHALTAMAAISMIDSAVAANPALSENDATAKALGYVSNASKTKDPKHQAGQTCAGCNFYQGAANSKAGACALFPGKDVASAGWCKSWVKKAA